MAGVRIRTWLRRLTVVVVVLFILPVIGTGAAGETSPTAGWQTSTPEEQGIRSDVLADMLERVRWNQYRIDSVSIVRNGYLVLDVYFHSRSKDAMHATYSATKSVMSALIGIAIDKGYIGGVTEPVLSLLPERQIATADARKRSMTLEHLLTMTTGLKCRDSNRYGYVGYMKMRQSADWTQFVLDLPMEADPGKRFEYCNGASFLLSAILAKATKSDVLEFAQMHLFSSLGIKDVFWSRSSRNIRNGCCGLSLTPHDMAKFGWLFLNRGEWNGRRVISSAWVDRAIRRHVDVSPHHYYGYQWWRDARGYYMAIGHKGQRIFVIPSKKMVVVFTGTLERSTALAPEALLDTGKVQFSDAGSHIEPSRPFVADLERPPEPCHGLLEPALLLGRGKRAAIRPQPSLTLVQRRALDVAHEHAPLQSLVRRLHGDRRARWSVVAEPPGQLVVHHLSLQIASPVGEVPRLEDADSLAVLHHPVRLRVRLSRHRLQHNRRVPPGRSLGDGLHLPGLERLREASCHR